MSTYAKSKETIANILAAAEIQFVAKHYADVTMSDVAQAADVTKGALYHRFSSKDDLYLQMMQSYLAEQRVHFETAVATKGSCRERMRQFALQFLALPKHKQDVMRLVRRDTNLFSDPERSKLIQAYQTAVPQQIESIIQDGIHNNELADGDARLLAWQHVAIVEVILNDYAQHKLGSPEQIANFITNLFFDGAAK